MQELKGGRSATIYRKEDSVIRPLSEYSSTIHLLLQHLSKNGFSASPRFIKTIANNEVLSFIEGETYNYPLIGYIASEQALTSAALLLRQLHDTSADFLSTHAHKNLHWMLASRSPQEVICHGDFTPYNVALKGEQVVGVFDFDTAHPAPRVWDLAFAIYCWAPFKTDVNDVLGTLDDQVHRALLFCNSYGAPQIMREQIVDTMISRLQTLVDYMHQQATQGDTQFIANIEDGHHIGYLNDIDYLQQNRQTILSGIGA